MDPLLREWQKEPAPLKENFSNSAVRGGGGGNPSPGVTWYKDGKQVMSTVRMIISPSGDRVRISNIRYPDGGEYACVSQTTAGLRTEAP